LKKRRKNSVYALTTVWNPFRCPLWFLRWVIKLIML